MGLSSAEKQRRHRLKKQAERLVLPAVPCACGCGTLIPPITVQGKPASYAWGHNPSMPPPMGGWNKGQPAPWASATHKGKKLTPEQLDRRTKTRRSKYGGAYVTDGKTPTELRDPATWRERVAAANRERDMHGPANPFYGRTHAPEARARMGQRGPESHQWRGGTGYLPYTPEFNRRFKALIRQRDGNCCQRCGKTREQVGRTLHVHHIDLSKSNNDPSNLTTLCFICHRIVHPQHRH